MDREGHVEVEARRQELLAELRRLPGDRGAITIELFREVTGRSLTEIVTLFGSFDAFCALGMAGSGPAVSSTLRGVLTKIRRGEDPADDTELARRLDHAFSKHYERLRGLVARELRGFSDQQIEDTVQEVLLVAWRRLPEHDGRHFRAWLFAIATRTCANVRRKRREAPMADLSPLDPGSDWESAYGGLRRVEREEVLLEASRRVLDEREQEVVYMRYELDLPNDEIGRLTGLGDANAVRVALQRAKRRLGREIEKVLAERGHTASLLADDPPDAGG